MSPGKSTAKSGKKPALRRCTGCLQMIDKRSLIRVVLNQESGVSLDPTGKAHGRGAYLCKDAACFAKAAGHKGLEKSFKSAVPKEVYERLKTEIGETEKPVVNV